jgi:hypothetical protein
VSEFAGVIVSQTRWEISQTVEYELGNKPDGYESDSGKQVRQWDTSQTLGKLVRQWDITQTVGKCQTVGIS